MKKLKFFLCLTLREIQRKLYMVDFNSDIPNGRPQLDANYWKNLHKPEPQPNVGVFDVNTNFALKDLSDISVFKGKK